MAISVWLLLNTTIQNRYDPIFVNIISVIGILFFSITGIFGCKKYFDTKPGLLITKEGFIDNSSALSIGMVKWSDVESIRTIQIQTTRMMIINVVNPKAYIGKATSFWKKKLMQANYKLYGSPIFLASNSLKTNFDDLQELLNNYKSQYGNT